MNKWQLSLALALTACQQPVLSPLNQFPNQSLNQQNANSDPLSPVADITSGVSNQAIQSSETASARRSENIKPAPVSLNKSTPSTNASSQIKTGVMVDVKNATQATTAQGKQASPQATTLAGGFASIPISSLHVPQDFNYVSTQDVTVDVTVSNPNGEPYSKVMVAIYASDGNGLTPLIRGVTDNQGHYLDLMRVAGYHKELNIQVSALGINNSKTLPIQKSILKARFGKE